MQHWAEKTKQNKKLVLFQDTQAKSLLHLNPIKSTVPSYILPWYVESLILQFNLMKAWIKNTHEKQRELGKFLKGEK